MPVLQTLAKKLNKDVFQKGGTHACRETLGRRRRHSPGHKTSDYKPFIKPDKPKSPPSPAALGKTVEQTWILGARGLVLGGTAAPPSTDNTFVFTHRKIKRNRVKMTSESAFLASPELAARLPHVLSVPNEAICTSSDRCALAY